MPLLSSLFVHYMVNHGINNTLNKKLNIPKVNTLLIRLLSSLFIECIDIAYVGGQIIIIDISHGINWIKVYPENSMLSIIVRYIQIVYIVILSRLTHVCFDYQYIKPIPAMDCIICVRWNYQELSRHPELKLPVHNM